MRDLRSPVFLHIDGGRILINLMFGLASVRRDGRLRAKCGKQGFARKKTGGYGQNVENWNLPVNSPTRCTCILL